MERKAENIGYRMKFDLHTHTVFSHGTGTIEENLLAARAKGVMRVGITDHGPGHLFFGIKRKDIPVMRREIDRLKDIYPDMDVLLGVEANIINKSGWLDVQASEFSLFDYVIAGYHYGVAGVNPLRSALIHGGNLISRKAGGCSKQQMIRNTELVLSAIHSNDIKILTHPGDKAPVDMLEVAAVCAQKGTWIEINTWHKNLTENDLKTMALTDVKFVISSDAHSPDRVGDFIPALKLALASGLELSRIVNLEM
ncbi:MAG: PHP domain-containing protein [Clostridiales Family XIII bacterium]|jgi:putative hydrolase|nr:PHP domain-containing protein [Clostridiales Family XIII bacterium]